VKKVGAGHLFLSQTAVHIASPVASHSCTVYLCLMNYNLLTEKIKALLGKQPKSDQGEIISSNYGLETVYNNRDGSTTYFDGSAYTYDCGRFTGIVPAFTERTSE
jgi:hypothetical protein